jgi:hypothetical protein
MPEGRSIKCSECARRKKPCVNVSWEWLDRERSKREAAIEEDKARLEIANSETRKLMEEIVRRQNAQSELMEKIRRDEATLRRVHNKAKEKTICLLDELEEEEKEERERKRKRGEPAGEVVQSPDYSALLGVSDGTNQIDWFDLDLPPGAELGAGGSEESLVAGS